MKYIKKININWVTITLFTPLLQYMIFELPLKRYKSSFFVIIGILFFFIELVNLIMLVRSLYGCKNNEHGSILAMTTSIHALIVTFVLFVLFAMF